MRERQTFERELAALGLDERHFARAPGAAAARRAIPRPAYGSRAERETAEGVRRKLKHLALLSHSVEKGGVDVALKPDAADPGFYDGADKYRVSKKLQDCLARVMAKREFGQMKVALVDLTKGMTRPEFAGFNHKAQVFAASVPKLAAMLAAFQLRQDLRAAKKRTAPATAAALFAAVRDEWAETQRDPGSKPQPFTRGLSLRGKLVLVGGSRVSLADPKAPRLEAVFGDSLLLDFTSTGETKAQLQKLVDDYNLKHEEKALKAAKEELTAARRARDAARQRDANAKLAQATKALTEAKGRRPKVAADIKALGFRERLGICVGGDVPASNLATSRVVRDLGYLYVASTLLQSGLYDTSRSPHGGLWLGADYGGATWRGGLLGGVAQSATAGSAAAFLTLLVQKALVSPVASGEMRDLLIKFPALVVPGTGSWFRQGLKALPLKTVLGKVGLAGGADDCAYIERSAEVTAADGTKKPITLCYVAVALRAADGNALESVIRELDQCVLDNNS